MASLPSRSVVLTSVALAWSASSAATQSPLTPDLTGIPPEKVAAVREHLRASGAAEGMVAGIKAGLESQRAMAPDVPPAFWDEFVRRLVADIDRFLEALIPLYHEKYTLEELEGLTAFYLTPLGQRLIVASTELTLETAALGEQWGAIVGAEVMLDLANRGLVLPN